MFRGATCQSFRLALPNLKNKMSGATEEKVSWMVKMGLKQPELSKTFVPVGSRKLILKQDNNYLSNVVSTGKYSPITFLPKFLFEFFSKAANVFFLFTGTIQLIPDLSPFNRFGTILPLTFIGVLVATKELSEDRKRHQQDRTVNARLVKVFRNGKFEKIAWRDVIVGDILRIENGEYFPSDLVALSSSEPDALCYIETANLDGETNLKIRQGIPETAKLLTPESLHRFKGEIESELPNNSLYTFEAVLKINGKDYALSPNQLLLRGAQLKNTRWVYAAVVFTGHETKLMKNSTATPIKQTKIEKLINSQILLLFFLVITVALICAIGQYLVEAEGRFLDGIVVTSAGKQTSQSDKLAQIFPHFLTFIILFNNFIPLSLIVTVEFVRLALAFFINFDLDMYYDVNDTPATARTSSLVEELGQVDYIFSDKTGTLTRNIMEFKMSSIGGIAYAETVPEEKAVHLDDTGKEVVFNTLI